MTAMSGIILNILNILNALAIIFVGVFIVSISMFLFVALLWIVVVGIPEIWKEIKMTMMCCHKGGCKNTHYCNYHGKCHGREKNEQDMAHN